MNLQHGAFLCRHFVRDHQKAEVTQVELFLNQVKLLVNLSQDEKMRLLDALEEVTFTPGTPVIKQVPAGPLNAAHHAGMLASCSPCGCWPTSLCSLCGMMALLAAHLALRTRMLLSVRQSVSLIRRCLLAGRSWRLLLHHQGGGGGGVPGHGGRPQEGQPPVQGGLLWRAGAAHVRTQVHHART
jgi:hypothetical protein